ncbi:MAG: hypothetical protein KJO07_14375 [Deltaproteobacteria bacterium]|nr:hypothetical protein [Deltaproteobacteria bacterium]
MTSWHRFRLWRLDANRDKADEVVRQSLGSKYTAEELQALEPEGKHLTSDVADALDGVIAAYVGLRARCQKQANSMLVPC